MSLDKDLGRQSGWGGIVCIQTSRDIIRMLLEILELSRDDLRKRILVSNLN